MKLGLFVLLVTAFTMVHECYAQEPEAEVIIEVIDSLGVPIDWANSVLVDWGTGTKYKFVDNLVRVPLGNYLLRIEAQGFAGHEHRLRVLQPTFFVRVALDISDVGAGHTNRVSGTVGGKLPEGQDLWVRLVPLVNGAYSDMDHKLSDQRAFELVGMPNGEYLLLLLGGCRDVRGYPTLLTKKELSVWGRIRVDLKVDENTKYETCVDQPNVK